MDQRDQDNNESKQVDVSLHRSTPLQAFFNFTKSIIGIGIIALPFATQSVGWFYAIVLGFPILYIGIRANILLIEVADHLNGQNLFFAEIARITLGVFWGYVVQFFIVFLQIGLCIAYLIFLADSIVISLEKIQIEIPKYLVYASTLIVIIPLSLIRRIHSFHKISKYGLYFALGALILVVGECLTIIYNGGYNFENAINLRHTFKYIGLAFLICEGIVPSLNIRESMHNKYEFIGVAKYSIGVAFLTSFIIAFFAVVTYGSDIKPIVIFNLMNPYVQFIAVLLYSISLFLTYAIQLFPAVQIIEDIMKNRYVRLAEEEQIAEEEKHHFFIDEWDQILLRMAIMIMIYLIAYWVPHFSHFLELIGSVFLSALFFIFPAFMHMLHFKNSERPQPVLLYSILLTVGFASLIFGTLDSLMALME